MLKTDSPGLLVQIESVAVMNCMVGQLRQLAKEWVGMHFERFAHRDLVQRHRDRWYSSAGALLASLNFMCGARLLVAH